MRVGVEEPGRQDLLVVGLEQLTGRLTARLARGRLQQRYPLDFLHDQQPPVDAGVHARHREPVEGRQNLPHPLDAGRLVPEVQLA